MKVQGGGGGGGGSGLGGGGVRVDVIKELKFLGQFQFSPKKKFGGGGGGGGGGGVRVINLWRFFQTFKGS